jgi:hypothetical protein
LVVDSQRLFELYSENLGACLDAGSGDCWLKEPNLAELTAGALRFFHGRRYDLGPWVVMPNRVHVIVRPSGAHWIDQIVKSWKGLTPLHCATPCA